MSVENIGPADELGLLRDEMKRLEVREKQLRAVLLNDPEARVGKRFVADIVTMKRTRIDMETLKLDYPEVAQEVIVLYETTSVRLSGITADGESVSLRELRRIVAEQGA